VLQNREPDSWRIRLCCAESLFGKPKSRQDQLVVGCKAARRNLSYRKSDFTQNCDPA
jgi:hypothetical protein